MKKLIVLGTGNAAVTRCYNTCFALKQKKEYLLVDAGGGNGILSALASAEIPLKQIHHFFVTHAHSDHILGVPWIIRMIGTRMNREKYQGELHIYCHRELANAIRTITSLVVQEKISRLLDRQILFHILEDGSRHTILGSRFTFLDIRSSKAKQFGFLCETEDGMRIAFPGDEPCPEHLYPVFSHADWLLHEAFCRYADRDRFSPYEKCHSTVRDACLLAEKLAVRNLVLWHTEDSDLPRRRETYLAEGSLCFSGNLYVPEDGEIISLAGTEMA
ncbi:MAG TPA: MBL fold metallo-hydrolase [Candidatus Scatomonas pullistercoris]|uniref:MBL fold metallo-hydrolase n=1 Tax=Candidatus Scatomonas pullistercoris TaxID=2840920 RepID=A0A9D1P2H1_9FIRM|nr:MBL fold metallo-hydrolase [Candidatus Scatomonas pullistercoris]